jgi:hypothetical protein
LRLLFRLNEMQYNRFTKVATAALLARLQASLEMSDKTEIRGRRLIRDLPGTPLRSGDRLDRQLQ